MSGKYEFAVAVISNCGNTEMAKRMEYINELRKYINVDVFGKCGKPCPTHFRVNNMKGDCKDIIGKEYKFYFAFENSFCSEYKLQN